MCSVSDGLHYTTALLGVVEEVVVVWSVLVADGLDDLLRQDAAYDGADWAELGEQETWVSITVLARSNWKEHKTASVGWTKPESGYTLNTLEQWMNTTHRAPHP